MQYVADEQAGHLKIKLSRRQSKFQEEAQERLGITPNYTVLEDWGPDHAKISVSAST